MTGGPNGHGCGACGRFSPWHRWKDYACPKCGAFARGLWLREAADRDAWRMTLEQIAEEYRAAGRPDMVERVLRRTKAA